MPDRNRQRPDSRQRPGTKPGTTHEQRDRRERFERARRETLRPDDDVAILYGWHTVKAALENPARQRPQAARHRKCRPPADRGKRDACDGARDRAAGRYRRAAFGRRGASGALSRSRSPALAADRRDRAAGRGAGARPDHRPAQRRRDLPLGRRVRRVGHRDHRASQPRGHRRAGEIRLRRARARAADHGAEPVARIGGAQGARLLRGGARFQRRQRPRRRWRCASRSLWCSAPKAGACGNSPRRPAITSRGSNCPARSRASTCRTPPRSRSTSRAQSSVG